MTLRTSSSGVSSISPVEQSLRKLSRESRAALSQKKQPSGHSRATSVAQAASFDGLGGPRLSSDSSVDALQEAESPVTPQSNGAEVSMEEYAALKKQLLGRAKRAAGFLTAYIALQQGLVAGACTVAGGLTGFVYLNRIIAEVDQFNADSRVPMMAAIDCDEGVTKKLSMLIAGYRQALRPRWLLPIGLAAAVQAFNRLNSGLQITNLQEFDMLLGFLCYKAGLFLALYDDVKPKFDPSKVDMPARPTLSDAALSREEADKMEELLKQRKRH